jgi:hypothetical protein
VVGLRCKNKIKKTMRKIIIGIIFLILILTMLGVYLKYRDKSNDPIIFNNNANPLDNIKLAYDNVKSFEVSGSFNAEAKKESANGSFFGTIVLPEDMQIVYNFENKSVYNSPDKKTPQIKKYGSEVIVADEKIFRKNDQWKFSGLSPMAQQSLWGDTKENPLGWLTLLYADSLEYSDSSNGLHHYKIKQKNINFGDAISFMRGKYQMLWIINAWDVNQVPTNIEGDVWINDQFQITREKYKITAINVTIFEDPNNSLNIDINYSNFNKKFKIKKPIDTSDIDKVMSLY